MMDSFFIEVRKRAEADLDEIRSPRGHMKFILHVVLANNRSFHDRANVMNMLLKGTILMVQYSYYE